MLEDGRLHLTGARLLAPHLTQGNCNELLVGSVDQRASAIRVMLAQRFGTPEPRATLRPIVSRPLAPTAPLPSADESQLFAGASVGSETAAATQHVSKHVVAEAGIVEAASPAEMPPSDPVPILPTPPPAPLRFELRCTLDERTHELLRQAQALLSHSVPAGDVGQVLRRALELLVPKLERQKFGATDRPQRCARPTNGTRHIPAQVRHAVLKRDQGQCTFVGDDGHRCSERRYLELDHVVPVARGGGATVGNLRLRCRAHNQLEAERTFGAGFMQAKREGARDRAAERREPARAEGMQACTAARPPVGATSSSA